MHTFQGPVEVSGQVFNYSKAIRLIGHDSTAAVFHPHEYGYRHDELIYPNGFPGKLRSRLHRIKYTIRSVQKYDLFNYWAGKTLLDGIDLQMMSLLEIPTVMTFCGSEIRPIYQAAKQSEFLDPNTWPRESREHNYFERLNDHLDLAVYQYHELEPYVRKHFDNVAYVPRAVDCELITSVQPTTDDTIRVAHAPSDRQLKGTKYVTDAIDSLKQRGYDIELTAVEGQHHEVIQDLQQADIVVDQLKLGTFGVVSLEAMASGTPVICYMRDDLRKKYPEGLPIINGTPNNIERILSELAEDPERRHRLGSCGRRYVENNHSLPIIGEKLIEKYDKLL